MGVIGLGVVVGGVNAVGIKYVEKDADVFETGVHALAVERHHSVRGVAEDDG